MGALAWVEVLDHRGQVRTRHRIDAAPAIIGRGYGSDVLLDDPWLSPVHLRLFRELDGSLAVEDARSENGTWSPRGERVTALPIGPGVVLRVGRTLIRIVPADAPVAATLGAHVAAPAEAGWGGRWAGPVLALVAGGYFAWLQLLGDSDVHRASTILADTIGMTALLALWAGIWALVTRAVTHRASFRAHLAVVATAAIALLAVWAATEYAAFLAPGEPEFEGTIVLVGVVILAAMLFGHLMLAGSLPVRRAIVISLAVTVGLFSLGVLAASDGADTQDGGTPRFAGELKPLRTAVIPTQTDSAYFAQFAALKASVDSLASDDE